MSGNQDDQRLVEIRDQIDSLDQQIQDLISRRAGAAQEVARIKLAADPDAVFYRPEREAQILRRVKERNRGPLDDESIARLFREIMSACLALEKPLNVAFLGPAGTFSQAAAIKHFGHAVQAKPMASLADVFRDVESGACQYGVVPVENSTEGVVNHTLDLFQKSELHICGEVMLRIHHHLMGLTEDRSQIQVIYSHQQSLAQCRGWLDTHLPSAERVSVPSNAEAARLAAEDPAAAALAGESAGEIYGLQILASNVEDEPQNTTRFLVVGPQMSPSSGKDKTSLLLSCHNRSGALHSLLTPLAEHEISMTRIESRPSRNGLWDYVFFIDVEGHADDEKLSNAFVKLKKNAKLFKLLGSYPQAEL